MQPVGICIAVFAFVTTVSCNQGEHQVVKESDLKEPLIELNISEADIEKDRIDAYVKRHQWDMVKTGTGLRYYIYYEGYGAKAEEGMVATVGFKISLLDGTVCYSSEESGPEQFLIGRSDVESGLHQGITYLKVGDKAKLILPSHLAHGLVGDREKIPPRATIIYDIELLALQ